MSVFIRAVLDSHAHADVDSADLGPPDDLWWRHLDGVAHRVRAHGFDVRDAEAVRTLVASSAPDVIVHGATVTQAPDRELADPTLFVEVNIGGTTHVLDAARRTSSVHRRILISSGAVYGTGTTDGLDPNPRAPRPGPTRRTRSSSSPAS